MNEPTPEPDAQLGAAVVEYWQRVERGEPVDRGRFLADHADSAGPLASYFAAIEEFEHWLERSRTAPPSGCPGPAVVRAVALGRVSEKEWSLFLAHLRGCPRCQDLWQKSTQEFDTPQDGATLDTPHPSATPATEHPIRGGLEPLPRPFGRYEVVRRLGKGGMGQVYFAHDPVLGIPVALKVPDLDEKPGPEMLERFHREVQAAARINHPNLCRVYDAGQVDGIHYLVMQYVEGVPLSEKIQGGRQLPEAEAVALVARLATALGEAHARGVVHRDLKPSNIMIDERDGRQGPVVVDFGLAWHESGRQVTRPGQVLGTPAYMAPEQVDPEFGPVGPQSDVYSLGVILYQLLTGKLPFTGPVLSVLHQICAGESLPPSRHRPDLSRDLEAVCARAMARRPADRYASMAEFAAALARIGQAPTSRPAPPPAARSRRRLPWTAAAVILLALAAWAGWKWLRPTSSPSPPGDESPPLALYWHGFVQRNRDGGWEEHRLRDGMVLYDGDQFRVVFSTNTAAHVYLVNVGADGTPALLFPDAKIRRKNPCTANESYEVPDGGQWYTLDRQTGREALYLLASSGPLTDLEALFARPESDAAGRRQLAAELEAAVHRVEKRGGEVLDRGVTIEADKRQATARLKDGREVRQAMAFVRGKGHVVERIRFEHRPPNWRSRP